MPATYCSHEIHWGMCIDVFPLVAVEEGQNEAQCLQQAINRANSLLAKEYLDMLGQKARGRRQKLINFLPRCVRHFLVNQILQKNMRAPEENGHILALDEPKKVCAYSDLLVTEKHDFEGKLFSIPQGYDAVLKTCYGDYMTPPSETERGGHEQALGQIINDVHKDYKEYQAELRSTPR